MANINSSYNCCINKRIHSGIEEKDYTNLGSLRISPNKEKIGLDISQHDESYYLS